MKLALFSPHGSDEHRLGLGLPNGRVLDVATAAERRAQEPAPPASIKECLKADEKALTSLRNLLAWAGDDAAAEGAILNETDVTFHPPIPDPDKFICVGKNSKHHLEELVRTELIKEIPSEPTGFVKLNSVMVGQDAKVARPEGIIQFDYEPEMAFVIGKPGVGIARDDALSHVAGITVFNDLTAREIQKREVQSGTRFWTAKNMPGFGPIGPYLVTLDEIGDTADLWVTCHVNGELRSRFSTRDLIYKIPEIIEHFSR